VAVADADATTQVRSPSVRYLTRIRSSSARLKVARRADGLGIGADKKPTPAPAEDEWWLAGFQAAAAALPNSVGAQRRASESSAAAADGASSSEDEPEVRVFFLRLLQSLGGGIEWRCG